MSVKLSNDISLWLDRLVVYFIIYTVIIGSHLYFKRFDWWHTDVESARALLTALATGEAAILAIIVSLSLVAVQLAASSYSARVIEVFRRTPDLWILILVYGVAIFYGLGVLKLVGEVNPQGNGLSNLEGHIAFSYYLGVFAFVALVPYIWKTLDLLKPSMVINLLAEHITNERILLAIEEKSNEKDPIQPVIDIVRGSIMKCDYETVRDGVVAIGKMTNLIFEKETFKDDEEIKLSRHLFGHLTRIGRLATSSQDDGSAYEVITILCRIGIATTKKNWKHAAWQATESIGWVGKGAAEQKLEGAAWQAAYALEKIGEMSAKLKFEGITQQAAISLGLVGKSAAEQKLETAALRVLGSLELIGIISSEQKLKNEALRTVEAIRNVGDAAIEQKLKSVAVQTILSLTNVGKIASEYKLEDTMHEVESSLKDIADSVGKFEQ